MKTRILKSIELGNYLLSRADRMLSPCSTKLNHRPIFIVGPPRSGTTLAYQVLCHSLRVAYIPRLMSYSYGLKNLILKANLRKLKSHTSTYRSTEGKINGLLSPSENQSPWVTHNRGEVILKSSNELTEFVHDIQNHFRGPLLAKSLYLTQHIKELDEVFETPLFIYMKRSIVDNASSIIAVRQRKPESWWSIKPHNYHLHLKESLVDQTLWQLREIHKSCHSQLSNIPSHRIFTLNYEELCNDPPNTLSKIENWLEKNDNEAKRKLPFNDIPNIFERHTSPPEVSHSLTKSIYYISAEKACLKTVTRK